VLSLEGLPGSVLPDGSWSETQSGAPGVWLKHAEGGKVLAKLCPPSGALTSILRVASSIVPDPHLAQMRLDNPSPL
jgi:hypothetical protein